MLDLAVQNDVSVRSNDVLQEGLIRPDGLDLTTRVLDQGAEQSKPWTAGRHETRVQHVARDGRHLSGLKTADRPKTASIFVSKRESKEQILDGE